jgi:DNA invertase Pin-like site-specific DNA recombinase
MSGDFDVPVKTLLPAAQFKVLNRIATEKKTNVGTLVRELVRRQLDGDAPVYTAPVPSTSVGRAGRLFGPEQIDKLRELYERGLSDVQIATELGYTTSTVHRRRNELGLPSKRPQFTPKAMRP